MFSLDVWSSSKCTNMVQEFLNFHICILSCQISGNLVEYLRISQEKAGRLNERDREGIWERQRERARERWRQGKREKEVEEEGGRGREIKCTTVPPLFLSVFSFSPLSIPWSSCLSLSVSVWRMRAERRHIPNRSPLIQVSIQRLFISEDVGKRRGNWGLGATRGKSELVGFGFGDGGKVLPLIPRLQVWIKR